MAAERNAYDADLQTFDAIVETEREEGDLTTWFLEAMREKKSGGEWRKT